MHYSYLEQATTYIRGWQESSPIFLLARKLEGIPSRNSFWNWRRKQKELKEFLCSSKEFLLLSFWSLREGVGGIRRNHPRQKICHPWSSSWSVQSGKLTWKMLMNFLSWSFMPPNCCVRPCQFAPHFCFDFEMVLLTANLLLLFSQGGRLQPVDYQFGQIHRDI